MTYTVNQDYLQLNKGETVYPFYKNTFGILSDDEAILGVPCVAVTRNPDGDYPFIVLPQSMVEEND